MPGILQNLYVIRSILEITWIFRLHIIAKEIVGKHNLMATAMIIPKITGTKIIRITSLQMIRKLERNNRSNSILISIRST